MEIIFYTNLNVLWTSYILKWICIRDILAW